MFHCVAQASLDFVAILPLLGLHSGHHTWQEQSLGLCSGQETQGKQSVWPLRVAFS